MKSLFSFRLTRAEKNWVLYDVGNSAFVLLVSTIIPSTSITLPTWADFRRLTICHTGGMQPLFQPCWSR